MTRGARNFIEESETRKTVRKYWACCKFIWVHILFPTLFGFIFISFVNIHLYIFIECV